MISFALHTAIYIYIFVLCADEVLKESIEASGRVPCDQHHLGDMAVLKKVPYPSVLTLLPAYPHTCLPACLPTCLPTSITPICAPDLLPRLSAYLPACLLTYLHPCLPAYYLTLLPAYLPTCSPACRYLPTLPFRLPVHLLVCPPSYSPACYLSTFVLTVHLPTRPPLPACSLPTCLSYLPILLPA
jgi:hypothetical protein